MIEREPIHDIIDLYVVVTHGRRLIPDQPFFRMKYPQVIVIIAKQLDDISWMIRIEMFVRLKFPGCGIECVQPLSDPNHRVPVRSSQIALAWLPENACWSGDGSRKRTKPNESLFFRLEAIKTAIPCADPQIPFCILVYAQDLRFWRSSCSIASTGWRIGSFLSLQYSPHWFQSIGCHHGLPLCYQNWLVLGYRYCFVMLRGWIFLSPVKIHKSPLPESKPEIVLCIFIDALDAVIVGHIRGKIPFNMLRNEM